MFKQNTGKGGIKSPGIRDVLQGGVVGGTDLGGGDVGDDSLYRLDLGGVP